MFSQTKTKLLRPTKPSLLVEKRARAPQTADPIHFDTYPPSLACGKGRLKILHITTVDITLRFLCLNLLVSLRDAGYEVVVASAHGAQVQTIRSKGLRHVTVPMKRRLFAPLSDCLALFQLYRLMKEEKFAIVHTHTLRAGILGRIAAKFARVPVICHTFHGFAFYDRASRMGRKLFVFLERLAALCSDLMFSANQQDIETARQEGIGRCTPIVLLGPGGTGIDLEYFNPGLVSSETVIQKRRQIGLLPQHRIVGFVGRLVRGKGLEELFEAALIVRRLLPELRFLIVGPVDYERPDYLRPEAVARSGIEDICTFTGLRQDVRDLYALMEVFVLPSHSEGFPLSLMEASAMGIPCITTNSRGCREVVQNKNTGLVVASGNGKALARAILHIMLHPDEARAMGHAARQMALARFDERKVFAHVKAKYDLLLKEKLVEVCHARTANAIEAVKS